MQETDLSILSSINETLSENPDARQRDIARKSSLSLGMTNAVLRRFAGKGWIMMRRLSTRKIRYVLTPTGMNELARRSARYMRRTFEDAHEFYDAVRNRIHQAEQDGYEAIILYGESDVSFIIDYACRQEQLSFIVVRELEQNQQDEADKNCQTSECLGVVPEVPSNALGIASELLHCETRDALVKKGCISVYGLVGKNIKEGNI